MASVWSVSCYNLFVSWRVTLLGKTEATREGTTVSRFESSRAVALLARLVLFPHRTHPREELVELLWPEVEPEIGRRRLRHVLGTLRGPLEAGLPPGSIFVADKNMVRLNSEAIQTDVTEFEKALKYRDFDTARNLYAGELLPGLYDDWILEERYRLEALAEGMPSPSSFPSPPSSAAEDDRRLSAGEIALPPYLTAFFGRETEREEVNELLSRSRLVTLMGLGGTGKTRLSVEVLRSAAPKFTHAAFVALGECLAAQQIPGRIRDVLGLPAVEADPLDQIAWKLSGAPALLVLDNLEQLVDSGGAELVETLLARLPQLTLLVTSRRALGIEGERLYPLEALPQIDALALFLDRVQATRPGFRLTAGNRDDVRAVCEGLEGIPLALELAAARIRAFSPSEMRAELDKRFEWLARTGLKGDKDDRHRSLAAALEWSWRLLPTAQQQFLANLSLFRAPFTASEAASVTGYPDARERLENLSSDSLIQCAAGDDSGETRHALLETVREFVEPRMGDSAEARARFRQHYLDRPTRDENTATAWQYALQDEDGKRAYAFARLREVDWSGLFGVGRVRGYLEETCALPCADPLTRLHAANELADCLLKSADRKGAMALIAKFVAPLEEIGGESLADGLIRQAHIGFYAAPHEETIALLDRCLLLTTDVRRRAEALRVKGGRLSRTSDFDEAQALFDEAEKLYPEEARGHRLLVHDRAYLAKQRKQYEEALRLDRLGAAMSLEAGDTALARNCQSGIPETLAFLERWDESIAEGIKCAIVEAEYGNHLLLLGILWNLALPFLHVGDFERAAKLQAATAAIWDRDIDPLTEEDRAELSEFRAKFADALDEVTLNQLWVEGEVLTLKEALALALSERTTDFSRRVPG